MKLKLDNLKGLISASCNRSIKLTLTFIFLNLAFLSYSQIPEAQLRKDAEQLFEDEDYTKAYKLYAQLVSNHPTDPLYNYRLGVCMIYSEPDKKKCFSYLNKAYQNKDFLPKDVTYFIGRAYHINYLFDEAIKFYSEFKKEAPSSLQKKLQVDREIKACNNGKRLLSALTDLEIISKKQLNEGDYFRSYDLGSIGGKLLTKPEDFKTGTDKKQKDKSIIYLPKSGERVYFSSYGSDKLNGKDIYYRERLPNGQFSDAKRIEGINTEYDEDYPFLHPNGKTLYFASKGHNSMGGYDIFKTTFIESSNSWTQPENLEFPINSPDDDYLYVTDSSEKIAYFSTSRYSAPGKIDVLKVKTERKPIDFIVMKGTVARETAKQSVKSKISITNVTTQEPVGTFEAEDNGNFSMSLPNGAKLLYTVETPGLKTQSQGIILPMATVGRPFKQTITYENGILKIINNFEEPPGDDSYLQYLKLIEEKAKLDPNEGKNKLTPTVEDKGTDPLAANTNTSSGQTNAANTANPTAVNTNTTAAVKNNTTLKQTESKTVTNEMLAIAKQDAEETQKEYKQINQDAADASQLAASAKQNAEIKLKEANEKLEAVTKIENNEEKITETQKAIALKKEAESDLEGASALLNLSQKLKEDAEAKKKEAALTKEYAAELEKMAMAKKIDPAAAKKIEGLQQQLKDLENRKPLADDAFSAIKNDASEKEEKFNSISEKTAGYKKELDELNNDIKSLETELAATKKKKQKAELNEKLTELNTEKEKVENLYKASAEEESNLAADYNSAKNRLGLTEKIKSEDFAKVEEPVTVITPTVDASAPNNKIAVNSASKQLEEKYADKIAISNSDDKNQIQESNKQLNAYNKEIDAQINKLKKDLAATNKAEAKKNITNEIKSLETTKKQNQQSIAANTKKLGELNSQPLAAAPSKLNNENLKTLSAENPAAVQTQLNDLKNSLNQSDNQYFNFNNYQNTNVQSTKIQADQEINDAYALQNKLKETIAQSEEKIKNSSVNITKKSDDPETLLKQSDELTAKAQQLKTQAQDKTGNERNALLEQASSLEKQAEEKQIQASEVSAQTAIAKSEINKENFNALIKAGKSDESSADEAKQLMEEADQALKQSKAIREEANAISNNAAKIGNLSNAEEKEQIAVNKQNEAIAILQKADKETPLKKYEEKGSVNITNEAVVKEEVAKINQQLNEVVNAKTKAYETLTKANSEELSDAGYNLRSNNTISSTPALKSRFVAIENNLQEVKKLEEKVQQSQTPNEKLVNLNLLAAKQNEILTAVNKLNADAAASEKQPLAVNQTTVSANTTKTENTAKQEQPVNTDKTDNSAKNNDAVVANQTETQKTNTVNPNENNSNAADPVKQNNEQQPSAASVTKQQAQTVFAVDLSYENHKDTGLSKINSYFKENNFVLKNTQANVSKDNALIKLNELNTSLQNLQEEIKNSADPDPENALSNEDIKSKIDNFNTAADNMLEKANDLRTEADEKSDAERSELISQAKQMEEKAFAKKIEASVLTYQYNQANYNANNNAINDLITKAGNKDQSAISDIKAKLEELEEKKKQAANMREEANALTSNAAKLGAIGNAEEEEADILVKQQELINRLKKYDPAYTVKAPQYENINAEKKIPANLIQKQNDINKQTISELISLTNAFNLEFETGKNAVPAKLTEEEKNLRNNIYGLNNEAKKLLVQSNTASTDAEKLKLLSLAAKTAHTAAAQLNILLGKQTSALALQPNNNVKQDPAVIPTDNTAATNTQKNTNAVKTNNANTNQTASANTVKTNTKTNNTANVTNAGNPVKPENTNAATSDNTNAGTKVLARVEGLEVLNKNAYSETKPIPVDQKMPDGLVFRVQIGAFKTRVPNNSFRGLTPVNGETTPNGFIRYTAGNFNKVENASAVKNDLNRNGYPDAFVVAFMNGKRISILEAMEILKNEGKSVPETAPQTAGINQNVNPNPDAAPPVNKEEPVVVTKELEQTKNMLFTVQIGVYSKQISKARLFNLSPIYTERLPNGLYRYTAGIYSNADRLITDKNRVIDLGVKDAFVSAYLEGKRIPFNEAKQKKESDSNILFETDNPIVFPSGNIAAAQQNAAQPPADVQPFTNNVKERPAPTPDNGVKTDEAGVSFKVQIGAYSRQVPADIAAKFSSINTWPVENKYINGLFIYNVGNFNDAKFAKALRDQMISLGITDAFITVYRDGVKLFGTEATNLMNR